MNHNNKIKALLRQDRTLTELEAVYTVLDQLASSNRHMDELLAKCVEVMTEEQMKEVGLWKQNK